MGFSVRFVAGAGGGDGAGALDPKAREQQNYTPVVDEDSNANPNWQPPHSVAVSRNAGPQSELIVQPFFLVFGQRIMTLIWSCVQLRELHRVALVSLCQLHPVP